MLNETGLHAVKGTNTYCGPAALASLLGITTDEAALRILALRNNRQPVKAAYVSELLKVINASGTHRVVEVAMATDSGRYPFLPGLKRQTLVYWMVTERTPGRYLAYVSGHFVTADVASQTLCDNNSHGPVYVRKHSHKRQFIKKLYRIVPVAA